FAPQATSVRDHRGSTQGEGGVTVTNTPGVNLGRHWRELRVRSQFLSEQWDARPSHWSLRQLAKCPASDHVKADAGPSNAAALPRCAREKCGTVVAGEVRPNAK